MTDELKYQLFLFTVPMIMSFILIGIAVKIYRKCKDSKYTAFPVAGETDEVRKFEVNLGKCAWQIIAAFFCNTCLSNNIDYY